MPDIGVILSTIVAGVLLGGILALTALGLSIVLGVMRLVNLAHGDFLVVGAYAGLFFLQFSGIDPLLGLPVVAILVGVLAIPLYRLLLAPLAERGAEAQMMTMFAVSIILENALRARLQRRHPLDRARLCDAFRSPSVRSPSR